jgi:predicted DNA-binding protein (UPF0251 family)
MEQMTKERAGCLICGKRLKRKRIKYCSMACYNDARYGKMVPDKAIPTRNPKCLEAVRLCQAGLTQAEAARQVGIPCDVVREWFKKYKTTKAAALFAKRVCKHCGKSLEGMSAPSVRIY